MSYATQRDEIYTQIAAVSGIGKVFKSKRLVNDWATFLNRFKTATSVINVCWFSRVSGSELHDGQGNIGSTDAGSEILIVDKRDFYDIELFYGFKDDDTAPSDYTYQALVDAIETKFRFLQNLNSTADRSMPLQRTASGLWSFGDVLCHRAQWLLEVRTRIVNTD